MKKVLILSYHALPMDVVASYRAKAFCDYFHEGGILPTLVTHRWEPNVEGGWKSHNEEDAEIIEENSTKIIIRLPRPIEKTESNSSLETLKHWINGDFDLHLLNSYKIFKNYLFNHLQTNRYDCVIAIFSPNYHLKLAYEINREFKIPYILDFRDLWDNQIITKSYSPSIKKRLQDFIIKYYWRRWLKMAIFFSTTSSKWTQYLENLSRNKGFIIPNGHEISIIKKPSFQDQFKLTYFGRIYPNQNLDLIIDGVNEFVKKINPQKFKLLLIGLKKTDDYDGLQNIQSKIDARYLEVIDYLPKEKLLEKCREEATMFFLPSFNEDNGQFMVKLYDFIALNKTVLIAPKVNSDMESVVNMTNSGVILSSVDSIVSHFEQQYDFFLKNGYAKNDPDFIKVMEYHRSKQVQILAKEINECLI